LPAESTPAILPAEPTLADHRGDGRGCRLPQVVWRHSTTSASRVMRY